MYLAETTLADTVAIEWDAIIIGAGAVGLILAVTLARANQRVLLLETGSTDQGSAHGLNEVEMAGRPHQGALLGRARTLGGTTTLWGGQLTQFVPYDFEPREILDGSRWPLSFGEIEPYYAQVAGLLGLDLAHLSDASLQSEGEPNAPQEASGCEIFFTRWLREANLARWFSDDLKERTNLTVAPSLHATEILCEGGASRITGVRAYTQEGRSVEFQAKNVILASGTIEISRLLLLTAMKNAQLQWCRNPNIGAYFQDHLDLVIGSVRVHDKKRFADHFENLVIRGYKYQPKIRMLRSTLSREGLLNIACSMRFDSRLTEDLQALKQFIKALRGGTRVAEPLKTLKRIAALNRVWLPLIWRYLRYRRVLAIADRGVSVIAHCEQKPLKESRISLGSKLDRFGDPLAKLSWAIEESLQMKSVRRFAVHLAEFLRTSVNGEFAAEPALVTGDRKILIDAQDSYHQCGGARMAVSPIEGVVDANCKVFGTSNLFVAGAAVFPSASFANPTYTAMALAKRLSDHLIGERESKHA